MDRSRSSRGDKSNLCVWPKRRDPAQIATFKHCRDNDDARGKVPRRTQLPHFAEPASCSSHRNRADPVNGNNGYTLGFIVYSSRLHGAHTHSDIVGSPSLHFVEIRSNGETAKESWNRLRLDTFNRVIEGSQEKSAYSIDIGVLPLHGSAQSVALTLANKGIVPAKWQWKLGSVAFNQKFAESFVDQLEHGVEAHRQKKIINCGVFRIDPVGGELLPGKQCHISIFYSPYFLGSHSIPSSLAIETIGEFPVILQGNTVHQDALRLYTLDLARQFQLDPVSIDCPREQAPVQHVEIRNRCHRELAFEVDLRPIQKVGESLNSFPEMESELFIDF